MQRHSAHFSSSSSPFWGALIFQQEPGLSKARIFLQRFLSQPLWFLCYLSPPTKGKHDFFLFASALAWIRVKRLPPGVAASLIQERRAVAWDAGTTKGFSDFQDSEPCRWTTRPILQSFSALGFLGLCTFLFVYISQYLQNFNECTVSCLCMAGCVLFP